MVSYTISCSKLTHNIDLIAPWHAPTYQRLLQALNRPQRVYEPLSGLLLKKTRQTICAEVKHHFKTTISDLFPISKFYLKFRDDTDELEVGSNGRLQNQELSSFTKTTTEKISQYQSYKIYFMGILLKNNWWKKGITFFGTFILTPNSL